MSVEAKVSMLFPSIDLEPAEQDKTERLDDAVARALLGAGITHRATWLGRSEGERRMIVLHLLVPNSKPVIELDAVEFRSLTDDQMVTRVRAALM